MRRTYHYSILSLILILTAVSSCNCLSHVASQEDNPLALLEIGYHRLNVISPTVLELMLVTDSDEDGNLSEWDFVPGDGNLSLPDVDDIEVKYDGRTLQVMSIGFKRRVLYAPIANRDVRIGNYLYLELNEPTFMGSEISVSSRHGRDWCREKVFVTTFNQYRNSPVIHANQVGYLPNYTKKAIVGYYLGSLGELKLLDDLLFHIIDADNHEIIFSSQLKRRPERGFNLNIQPYQYVYEADFTKFSVSGEYRLFVPTLGASFPFYIDDGIAAAFTRTYALGMYHQRCGSANSLPFTRFVHDECHIIPVEVPTMQFEKVQQFLSGFTKDYSKNPRHTASQLKDVNSSLYTFNRTDNLDLSGGHHDAGDYSKYTTNVAELVHYLIFPVDAVDGVAELDNLGLPESGDGISDFLQMAKLEGDYLSKLQDYDGGFYFMVYPRDKKYESHDLPDAGVPQVVYPKNSVATAAAVAALAQLASSPSFKKTYPTEADNYLERAERGMRFLENALNRYGQDGAYQKITHYGDQYMHDDELSWAYAEMFLATGEEKYHQKLIDSFDPNDRETMHWKWVRLYKAYGCVIRSYLFAEKSGRVSNGVLDAAYYDKCELELITRADQLITWADDNSYGTSFPEPSKRFFNGSYYMPMESMFDLATAFNLPLIMDNVEKEYTIPGKHEKDNIIIDLDVMRDRIVEIIIQNMSFVAGTNPNNVSFVTGLGWKRQREIVHQYAQNDRRVMPPSGFPLGSVQETFPYTKLYQKELRELSYPPDNKDDGGFPFYDRWGDSFNVRTEFVTVKLARAMATSAFLMTLTKSKDQPYSFIKAAIVYSPAKVIVGEELKATFSVPGMDISKARVLWEAEGEEPVFGSEFVYIPDTPGFHWIEAEAQFPDGKRAFAKAECTVKEK